MAGYIFPDIHKQQLTQFYQFYKRESIVGRLNVFLQHSAENIYVYVNKFDLLSKFSY